MSEQIQGSWPIPETMVDGITERLRQAIITGAIRPGERIRVADLERKFGVSHIPIREALRRLQSEGFVEISPRRTTIAAGVDLATSRTSMICVGLLRSKSDGASVSRMTKKRHRGGSARAGELSGGCQRSSSAEFWERHRDFHWALLAPAANPTVQRVLDHLWQSSERYVRLFVSTFATMDTVMDFTSSFTRPAQGATSPPSRTRSPGTTWKRKKRFAMDLGRSRRPERTRLLHFISGHRIFGRELVTHRRLT